MPGSLLHAGALVACPHGGQAFAVSPSARVMTSGSPVTTSDSIYRIVGCPHRSHDAALPCTTGRWLTGATRVLSEGRPLAIASGASACEPGGEPLNVLATQGRVAAA